MESSLLFTFLNETFVFRTLEIYSFFNHPSQRIFFDFRSRVNLNKIDNNDEPCSLLDEQEFDNWHELNKDSYMLILSEFDFYLMKNNFSWKCRKRDTIMQMEVLIKQELVRTINFPLELKLLINGGRKKVLGNRRKLNSKREAIRITPGNSYFLCTNDSSNIANPCYVLNMGKPEIVNSYRVIYFTDVKDTFISGKKTEINGWGFCTVFKNELGTTPEQALINKRL